jgi:ABC-2 type transport system permease protein
MRPRDDGLGRLLTSAGRRCVDEVLTVWAVTRHFLRLSRRNLAFTATALIIPINYLFLFLLTILNGAQAPTDVVVVGRGGASVERFVAAMHASDSFDIRRVDGRTAQRDFQHGQVVAKIVIPSDFKSEITHGRPAHIDASIDNVDIDFTDDIRRGLDIAIQRFGARIAVNRVNVVPSERDDVPHQVGYIPYVLISCVVVAIMVGGLFLGSVSVAREYELGTIVEMVLAPTSRVATLLGMVAGTLIVASVGVPVMVALTGVFGVRPIHWVELAFVCLLLLATFSAGGVLLGILLRRRNGLGSLAILLSLPMLSVSGAFFPALWSDPVIATIAPFTPTYYANALLEHAVHSVSTTPLPLWVDALVVAGFGAAIFTAAVTVYERRPPTT